ncbi:MAG: alpha/beta hydrolase [Aureispira sp.]
MSRLLLLLIGCCWSFILVAQLQTQPLTIGAQHQLNSTLLGEERQLNVYLPVHYHPDSSHQYPVLYVLDGGLDEDFLHISGLTQFGSLSWINLLPEVIVVGVVNVDRKRDFTFPTTVEQDQQDFPTTGQSAPFIQFIKEELQPLIDQNYPTNGQNTLLGQSLGGLLATQVLFEQPDLFDQYIIVSPSLWWDAQSLLQKTPIQAKKAPAIYIAVGKEGPVMQRTAKQLYKKMKTLPLHQRAIRFKYYPKNDHGDVLHLAAYGAFEFLFLPKK